MKIKLNEFEYKPTLDQLVDEIWDLTSDQQCALLDRLFNVDSYNLVLHQLQAVSNNLNNGGYKYAKTLIKKLYDGLGD